MFSPLLPKRLSDQAPNTVLQTYEPIMGECQSPILVILARSLPLVTGIDDDTVEQ